MDKEHVIRVVQELLAREKNALRDLASLANMSEFDLARYRDRYVAGGSAALGTGGPGSLVVDTAICADNNVTLTGTPTADPGEDFIGLHAELVETGGEGTPPTMHSAAKFEDINLAGSPGFNGDVLVWAFFRKNAVRKPLDVACATMPPTPTPTPTPPTP